MMQQALHEAQARLYQLQKQYDAAYSALEAEPSSDLKKERYQKLDIVLKKAQDAVNSLATTCPGAEPMQPLSGIYGMRFDVDLTAYLEGIAM
ncbi:TPA: hypothetical protein ACH3X1_004259 [Trebouxia sp. C0004]